MNLTKNQVASALAIIDKIDTLDAIHFAREYNRIFKTDIDWHEFSMLLDQLHTMKWVKITVPGGMVRYKVVQTLHLENIYNLSNRLGR